MTLSCYEGRLLFGVFLRREDVHSRRPNSKTKDTFIVLTWLRWVDGVGVGTTTGRFVDTDADDADTLIEGVHWHWWR